MTDENPKRTPLYEQHVALGGKMVPFAGYAMPVQYPLGIRGEHMAVREGVGLFDVSHMGEFEVRGPDALALVQKISVNDASAMDVGQVQYSAMCNGGGGIIDDLTILRFEDRFMLVVNAACKDGDWAWVSGQAAGMDLVLSDRSDATGLLALQGPKAPAVLGRLAPGADLDSLEYYRFTEAEVDGVPSVVARMGYTGEDGFEIYASAERTEQVWSALLAAGEPEGIQPAGLGSRDSLRLEVGFALYGNDLDDRHSPLESRLGWITKLDKGDFVGREAMVRQKEAGVGRRLVGLRLTDRGFPRAGYAILHEGEEVGTLTSGTVSPCLGIGIGMGRVPAELSAASTELAIDVRGKTVGAVVSRPPFYTDGSARR
jgi:glycine cleavage system T protein (aminomethyltransferase)